MIDLLGKILTNILTALYEPFGFSLLLSFLALFFYLYAYEPTAAGKGCCNEHQGKNEAEKLCCFLHVLSPFFLFVGSPVRGGGSNPAFRAVIKNSRLNNLFQVFF